MNRKEQRKRVYEMYGGRCAYCGSTLLKGWHIDHKKPIYRNDVIKPERAGKDEESNFMPSCPACNIRKGTFTIEGFRSELEKAHERLYESSATYRHAIRYGLIKLEKTKIEFYFEKYEKRNRKNGSGVIPRHSL